jgi:glycine betaine/proline transport system substrate-binding protein
MRIREARLLKTLIAASAVTAATLLSAQVSNASDAMNGGKSVVTCTSTSIEGLFHQMIPILGLRELGYTVDMPKTLSVPLVHQSISTGDCDYAVDEWVPLHDSFYKPIASTVKRLGPTIQGAAQGYLIDKASADKYHITSLEQFKDPAIAKVFSTSGNGKADLAGANPGWGSEKVINHELDSIGLRDTVNHNQGEYSVLIADTLARFKRGEPVFFYTWTPNWTTAEMKPGTQTIWLTVDPKSCLADQACGTSTTGFPLNDIYILANSDFIAANPVAGKFLSSVKIPLEDINAENLLIQQGQATEADVLKHAQDWVAAHHDTYEAWVSEAKK